MVSVVFWPYTRLRRVWRHVGAPLASLWSRRGVTQVVQPAIVTTGAAAVMQPTGYKAGDTVVAKFEGIGELTLNIAADSKL